MEVHNYKALKNIKFQLKPLTIIVGENGTGKSSILDCLRDFQHSSLQDAHALTSTGRNSEDLIDIILEFKGTFNLVLDIRTKKSDLTIDSICDLIPGALIAEQEKQEMLGVKVIGIPKDERVFISEDFPEGMYPWRRDETGPDKLYKNLHEVKK